MLKPNKLNIYLQILIASNLFPIYFIYQYHWSFFSVLWLYWLESLIVAVFDSAKIIIAEKNSTADHFMFYKCKLAFKNFVIQLCILLFYLLFMVVFVGFKTSSMDMTTIKLVSFRNPTFNYALVGFIISLYYQYLFFYVLNKKYNQSEPSEYFNFFNVRMIVLHIVIVAGSVIYEFWGTQFSLKGNTIFLVIFIIVKTTADFILFKLNNKENTENIY